MSCVEDLRKLYHENQSERKLLQLVTSNFTIFIYYKYDLRKEKLEI